MALSDANENGSSTERVSTDDPIQKLETILDRLPKRITKNLREEIAHLKDLLFNKRNPRFALVGRRGSGKSSLVNAIFGEDIAIVGHEGAQTGKATWHSYTGKLGTLELLDTRGLQEGSDPNEEDDAETPEDSVVRALEEKSPDAILFLVKATEVDAAIDGDVEGLDAISRRVLSHNGFVPPVFGVLTHCDQVEPQDVKLHRPEEELERDLQEKHDRIRRLETHLKQKIESDSKHAGDLVGVLGVSAYQSWRSDGSRRSDRRWHIDRLVEILIEKLPNEAKVEFARLSRIRKTQHGISLLIANGTATVCAGIASTPIPLSDIAPITGLQVLMISSIGYVYGEDLSMESARKFLTAIGANVGAGYALREAARALIRFLPGLGNAISAGIAYASTVGIGKVASEYFANNINDDELRSHYQKAAKEAKGAFAMRD
jgi:uncharacterized protein (DUF697 family)/predicted GTPase